MIVSRRPHSGKAGDRRQTGGRCEEPNQALRLTAGRIRDDPLIFEAVDELCSDRRHIPAGLPARRQRRDSRGRLSPRFGMDRRCREFAERHGQQQFAAVRRGEADTQVGRNAEIGRPQRQIQR